MKIIKTKKIAMRCAKGERNEEIEDWIDLYSYNNRGYKKSPMARQHIRDCLIDIIQEAFGLWKGTVFSRSVLLNDFFDASILADKTNIQVLDLYANFVHNYLSVDIIMKYRKKWKNKEEK